LKRSLVVRFCPWSVLAVLLSCLSAQGVSAQMIANQGDWRLQGEDLYSVPEGNVGIGTVAPAAKLEVAGRILADEFVSGAGALVDVRAFGADPADDGLDDQPALQAAVAHLEALGGGTLSFPPGVFKLGDTLTIRKPIWLLGAGMGDDSTVAGATASGLSVLRWDIQGAPQPMLSVRSAKPGHWLHGGGVKGIVMDGFNAASIGVQASSTSGWEFDGEVRRVREAAILLDGANGVLGTFNEIIYLKFVYGSHVSAEQADGLVLDGVTQTHVLSMHGLYFDGDMIDFRYTDNNIVEKLHGTRHPLGSGAGVRFSNAQPYPARNNLVWYSVGPVVAEDQTFGNRILHLISEGASVTVEPGAQLHYEAEDYVTSGLYKTPSFLMSDVRDIGTQEFEKVHGDAQPGVAGRQWTCWDLPPGSGSLIGANIAPPAAYDHGLLKGLDISFTTEVNNTGAQWLARVKVLVLGSQVGGDLKEADAQMDVWTTAFDSANVFNKLSVPFNVPYTRGDMIFLSVERLSGDSLQGPVQILGAQLHYEGRGPDSPGSGPFAVTAPGS